MTIRLKRGLVAGTVLGCALAVTADMAASKTSPPAGSYQGKTSAGLPVTFQIKNGTVRSFNATVHALCISVVAAHSYLDPIFHRITPRSMRVAGSGKFTGEYRWPQVQSTHAKVDGRVAGKSASGHYQISYSVMDGATLNGILIIYACSEKGTWKATRR